MKAMILAAGRGERLRPLTDTCPKPLIDINGRPPLRRHLEALAAAGVSEVVINLHHLAAQVREAVAGFCPAGITVSFSEEATLLETGGGISRALPLLGDAPFVVVAGDIVTDFDFAGLPLAPADDCLAHLVLVDTPAGKSQHDFSLSAGRVRRERPTLTYGGIAVLDPRLLKDTPAGPWPLRDALFPLASAGRLAGEHHDGYWSDIGTPSSLSAARQHDP